MTTPSVLLRLAAVAAGILLAAPPLARAAEDKPVVSITTRAIEVAVTIDEALAIHPGLWDDLLAEGRREAQKRRAEADAAHKKEPEFFTEGRKWSFERGYHQRSAVGRYVSITRDDSSYSGGAHGNLYTDTVVWDRETRKRISIRRFFTETADGGPTMSAIADAIKRSLAEVKKARELPVEADPTIDPQFAAVKPQLLKLGPVTLAPSTVDGRSAGLSFHFSPYMVGSYAEGPYTAFVPWTAFKPFLSAEGAAVFGGERPKQDEDDD